MTKPRDLATLGGGFTQSGTGAIQRTVENKLKDTVSVKDFGAVGDGVADDTAAIQAAIDYCSGKNTTLLLKGIYL
jgi:polygalacturonase